MLDDARNRSKIILHHKYYAIFLASSPVLFGEIKCFDSGQTKFVFGQTKPEL